MPPRVIRKAAAPVEHRRPFITRRETAGQWHIEHADRFAATYQPA